MTTPPEPGDARPARPDGFDLAASAEPADTGRPPGVPAPRSRLSSSSMRRASPLRPATAADDPAPGPRTLFAPPEVAAEPVPEPLPTSVAGRRRAGPVALAVGALLASVVGAAVLLLPDAGGGDPTARQAAAASSRSYPAPPVALVTDSEHVETKVLDDGVLEVTHWIRTTAPIDELTLSVPTSSGRTVETVGAEDLEVGADGSRVDVRPTGDGDDVWSGALGGVHEIYVSYRLTGAVEQVGSVAGRALAPLTSLNVDVGATTLARSQVFTGLTVLTLACLDAGARATPVLCGNAVEGAWTFDAAAGAVPDTVIAQLDLDGDR